MLGAKNRAAATAPENIELNESYRVGAIESTSKLAVGDFVLYLLAGDRRGRSLWLHLEAELRGGLG